MAESRLKELEYESKEKFNCIPSEIVNSLSISDDLETMRANLERTEMRLDRLKQQRETMGAVNLGRFETKEIDEELEKMTTEKEDLENAIKKNEESIEDLNKEGRTRLLSV